MVAVEVFGILVLLNIVFFVVGIKSGSEYREDVVSLLISAVLSFLIALKCFEGISTNSGTYIEPFIALLFAGIGLVTFILFVQKVFSVVTTLLQDPDFFHKKFGGI